MKTFKNIMTLVVLALAFASCKNETAPEVVTVETQSTEVAVAELDPNATYAKAEFTIEGMTCAMGCAKTIEKKMARMDGVKSAKVDFDTRLAMVEYDEAKVNATSLEEVVKQAGDVYSVKDMKTVDSFEGETTPDTSMDKKACDKDCKKACCADKTDAEKTACADDCKMACCADKAKA
ncbi:MULTISPECIES: heavy-metal-associated domain-containing protein [Bizionia]|uniref:Heavy-metal-associated domain-containing protein n=1 Tax=Bizionia algoritergicola TaxID=291187 RepID=A0A5D0QZX4_9FLAO|nr:MULTISPECIES: heavy metal-associated domain-containing protein [Bizionia]OBX21351.1 heavy metal transporter [Bizionia sp. APA-3]TYB74832.1 heavy-metal-associated domain-containing protein [Bizionia algoritergicola]